MNAVLQRVRRGLLVLAHHNQQSIEAASSLLQDSHATSITNLSSLRNFSAGFLDLTRGTLTNRSNNSISMPSSLPWWSSPYQFSSFHSTTRSMSHDAPISKRETIEEVRSRIFGTHIGNGLRSGRKILRKKLIGDTIASYYPKEISKSDPFMLNLKAERYEMR